MAAKSNAPLAGGFLLALSLLAGALIGVFLGQPSIGFLAGAGIGLTLLLLIWLLDRRRADRADQPIRRPAQTTRPTTSTAAGSQSGQPDQRDVGADRQRARRRVEREPFHHQRALDPEHVDAVAQPRRRIAPVDEDIVAVGQSRRHGIAGDPDDRELLRRAARHPPQPGGIEGDMAAAPFVAVERARARRGVHIEPGHRPQPRPGAGLGRTERALVHAKITGEDPPVGLGQPPRRAALDELLDVGGIAAISRERPG